MEVFRTHLNSSDFLRQSTIVFLASLFCCLCNYLYQIYVARSLGPDDYGIFCSLFSIFYIVYVLSGTVQTGSARFISRFTTLEKEKTSFFLQGLIKKAFLLGIAGLVVVLLVGPVLSSFLKIDSRVDMLVLAAIIALSFLPPATSGVLQGRQEFGWLSAVNISTFFPKLVSAIVFLRLGYGVNGALAGVAIGLAAAFLVSIMPIRSYMTPWNGGKDYNFKELYLYSLPAVIVMVCLAVPSNLDVVLARHFFTSKEAGLYAAAAVVGKIVLFLPGAISVVMFPKASKMCVQGGDSISLLNKSLICTAMLSGSAALVFIALPGIMVSIFGTVFAGSTSLAGLYAALMFVFTLVWVIAQYSLAARGSGFAVIMAIFTILELATISVLHSSPEEWILALILVNSLLFLSGYVMVTQARGVGH